MSRDHDDRPPNLLLQALSEAEYERLRPHLSEARIGRHEVLHEQDTPPGAVYFITSGLAELSVSNEEGKELAISLVGSEGMLGERAVLEGGLPLVRCAMVIEGTAIKLPPEFMKQEFDRGGELHELSMRCVEARLAETSQTALCNQTHTLRQRVARLLLTAGDRTRCEDIAITHDDLARMLAAARPGVTLALGELEEAGGLTGSRRRIKLDDRAKLATEACECYNVVKRAVETAFRGKQYPAD